MAFKSKANVENSILCISEGLQGHLDTSHFSSMGPGLATDLLDFLPAIWLTGILPFIVSFQNKAELSTKASKC